MIRNRNWPEIEQKHMGHILDKCWNYEYQDIEQVTSEVKTFIESKGWQIVDADNLKDLKGAETLEQLKQKRREARSGRRSEDDDEGVRSD
jgi:hypothetical protein